MRRPGENSLKFVRPLLVVSVVLGLWWLAGSFQWVNPLFLPRLDQFVASSAVILSDRGIFEDALITIYRAFLGLLISSAVAVPLGLLFGRFGKLYQYFELPVDFFRSIPSSALFFLFVLAFGIGDLSKVAVVFYGCSLVILVNTIYGARPSKDKTDRINMLRVFGASKWEQFRLAVFPDALPYIAAGLRVALSLAFVLVIVTEMFLGASRGLGKAIYDYYLAYRVPEMYVVIIFLGIIGFLANRGFIYIERRILFWLPKSA